jgi:hypothetical protein
MKQAESSAYSLTLMLKAMRSYEMTVGFHRITRLYIPGDKILNIYFRWCPVSDSLRGETISLTGTQ